MARRDHRVFRCDIEEQKVIVASALRRLGDENYNAARALVEHELYDVTLKEIGDGLGRHESSVSRYVADAKERLAALLEEEIDRLFAEYDRAPP